MAVSVNEELGKIEDFVRHYCKVDDIAGFNMYPSNKHMCISYIIAKSSNHPKPIGALQTKLDCVNPVERPLIVNAINRGMTGKDSDAETLENEMVCKAEDF